MRISRDALWKGIIENLFEDFLRFFYLDEIDEFDLEKGFEFLDKELAELFQTTESRRRYADKLVKVHTKDGAEKWILIHIEIQGYRDAAFAERMFDYFYRILEKYRHRIATMVIYTDRYPKFHPKEYRLSYLGTELVYKFRTYKLLEKTPEDFIDKSNPFAVVVETVWYSLQAGKLGEKYLAELYIELIKRLFEFGYTIEQIDDVLAFIIRFVHFDKPEITLKFSNELNNIVPKNESMGIHEAIIEDVKWQLGEKLKKAEEENKKALEEAKQAAEQAVAKKQKTIISNLLKEGFDKQKIATIMNISLDEMNRLEVLD